MSSKLYQQIADALKSAKPERSHPAFVPLNIQWRCDVDALAASFVADNPKFDRVRFLRACGDEEGAQAWSTQPSRT